MGKDVTFQFYDCGKEITQTVTQDAFPEIIVLGAGTSGLGVAGKLRMKGLDVLVIDQKGGVGGIWRDGYADLRIHSAPEFYKFLDDFDFDNDEISSESSPDWENKAILEYLSGYAKKHKMTCLFQTFVTLEEDGITILSQEKVKVTLKNKWIIDCRFSRNNAGPTRQLLHAQILSWEHLHCEDKEKEIIVIGGGKSGLDAINSLSNYGFKNVKWVIKRKVGFLNRDKFPKLSDYFYFSLEQTISPHDEVDCFKFGYSNEKEIENAKSAEPIFGVATRIVRSRKKFRVILSDKRSIHCDLVINALGPDSQVAYREMLKHVSKRLGMIDEKKKFIFNINSYGHATMGASMTGMLFALLLKNQLPFEKVDGMKFSISEDKLYGTQCLLKNGQEVTMDQMFGSVSVLLSHYSITPQQNFLFTLKDLYQQWSLS